MSAAFSLRDELQLESEAWKEFECQPLASGARRDKRRERKRLEVSRASNRFFEAMNSSTPPRSADEAVSMALPIGGWLLSWLFSTLAEAVIRWLWERTQESA